MQRRRFLVGGRVQGVGFRYFVRETAQELGLTGWVANLSGGDVLLEAQGMKKDLSTLAHILQNTPPHDYILVAQLYITPLPLQEEETEFAILR